MAPRNYRSNPPIKSYTRNTSGSKSTLDVLHNILTNPIQKKKSRRKPKIVIKELPPPTKQTCFSNSSESSLKLNANCDNTFDKLLNGTHYNKVTFKSFFKNGNSSESSLSKAEVQLTKHSPPVRQKRTRRRECYRSPIVTRSFCMRSNTSSNIEDKQLRTLEKSVNESLCIEKVKISAQPPTINFGISDGERSSSLQQMRDCDKENNSINTSYEPIFSKTFREKYNNVPKLTIPYIENAISSTPLGILPDQKIINETIISPIASGKECKINVETTPKLRRVSQVRKSRLIVNINGDDIISDENSVKTDDISRICLNSGAVLEVSNEARNDRKLFHQKPVVNLVRLDSDVFNSIKHCNKSDQVNNAEIDNEGSLNKVQDLISKIIEFQEDSIGKIMRQPLVNITNINRENCFNDRGACSNSFADSCITDYSRVNNIEDGSSQVMDISLFLRNPVVDLTNINTDNLLPAKSLTESANTSQVANFNESSSCYIQQSSEISSIDNVKVDINASPVNYVTLRRRKVVRKLGKSAKKSRSKSSNSNGSQDVSNRSKISDNDTKSSIRLSNSRRIVDPESDSLLTNDEVDNIGTQVSSQNSSSDLFRGFGMSENFAESNCDKMNTSIVSVDRKTINLIDASFIDSSYTELLRNKGKKLAIFSLRNSKRSRNSKFGQCIAISARSCQNLSSTSFDVVENTPIKVTKRRKVDCTAKENVNERAVDDSLQRLPPAIINHVKEAMIDLSFDTILDDLRKKNSTPLLTKSSISPLKVENSTQTDLRNINVSVGSVIEILDESTTEEMENYNDVTKSYLHKTSTILNGVETKPFIEVHEQDDKSLTPKVFTVPQSPSIITKSCLQNISDIIEFNENPVIEILDDNPTEETESYDNVTKSLDKTSTIQNDTQSFIQNHEKVDENLTPTILTVLKKAPSIAEYHTQNDDTNQQEEILDQTPTDGKPENHGDAADSTIDASEVSAIQDTAIKSAMRNDENERQSLSSKIFALPKVPTVRKQLKSVPGEELVLKSGKSWRRSLLEARNSKIGLPNVRRSLICVANQGDAACACAQCKRKIIEESTPRRLSVRVVPLPAARIVGEEKRNTVLADYAVSFRQSYISDVLHESLLEECFENLSLNGKSPKLRNADRDQKEYNDSREGNVTARDVVFRKCGQTEALPFEKCYPNSVLQHCQKIGEGVYGEVFLFRRPTGGTSVIKVIPIEGDLIVNGERQKKFEEILSEITIAMELSNLRHGTKNRTDCFSEVRKVTCVKGKYPLRLLELWELFEEARGTENDHPDIFDEDQLFMVLELANGGSDMESFVFASAQQAYALVTQVACALAVAESSLQFEHRDLHWGNILITSVDNDQTISFCIDGKNVTLDTFGVRVAIIDFTLSRICSDGVCIYNDLALDPDLFTATGDYQFEIYRLMQKQNVNDWQHYEPYTNILWLHYVLDKAIKAIRYRSKNTKIHRKYLRELKELKDEVLQYKSVEAFVMAKFVDVE